MGTRQNNDQSDVVHPNNSPQMLTELSHCELGPSTGHQQMPRNCNNRGNMDRYYVRVADYPHVFEDPKYAVVPKCRHRSSLISEFLFPRRPRTKHSRKREVISGHRGMIDGAFVEETSKGSPCVTSSKMPPHATGKRRKRKIKAKDESIDPEVTVQRTRFRGQMRRQNNCKTSTNGRGMLDSETFMCYFRHIWSSFPEEKVTSVAYFDPLWLCMYANQRNKDLDLTWIKKMNICSKKYVLVPIVMWSHWNLLIFCHLGESLSSNISTPCMVLLDSLHGIGPKRLEPLARRLLLDIYKVEERPEDKKQLKSVPFLTPKVPQQRNGDECGFFVLHFINLFLEGAPENFSVSQGYPYFMKNDWFNSEAMESFYKKLDAFPVGSTDIDSEDNSDSIVCVGP